MAAVGGRRQRVRWGRRDDSLGYQAEGEEGGREGQKGTGLETNLALGALATTLATRGRCIGESESDCLVQPVGS